MGGTATVRNGSRGEYEDVGQGTSGLPSVMHDLITMKENPNLLTESSRRHLESNKISQLKLQIIGERNSIQMWVDRGRNILNQICAFIP